MTVYLVGAGPGDPGLLTVRGAELLARADVVVHDRLASPALLTLAPATAELVPAGKAPGNVELTQDEINQVLVDRGRAGGVVVRLKGGDPFVFGRGGEEAEALAAAGVPFEVVPGVTSAIGAPSYAGIPVTHRGTSTHFTVVTGHEDPAKERIDVDWDALARVGGTLLILMGAGRVTEIARRLIEGGRAPDTPVAAVRNGTRPDQQTIRATLATIGDADVRAPSVIVVGDVAALDLGWFESRPLFGRSIVVTRAREQASELRGRLESLGAEVVELPAISIEPVDIALPALAEYAWLVFTSANGVIAFFDRGLASAELDARALAGTRIAAIGPGTAGVDRPRHPRRSDPRAVRGRVLARGVPRSRCSRRARVARPRRAGARRVARGIDRARVRGRRAPGVSHRSSNTHPDVLARVRDGKVDAITFTSSSTVDNLCDLLGAVPEPQPLVVSIGPVTSETARRRGLRVDAEAAEHTIDGLVKTLLAELTGLAVEDLDRGGHGTEEASGDV